MRHSTPTTALLALVALLALLLTACDTTGGDTDDGQPADGDTADETEGETEGEGEGGPANLTISADTVIGPTNIPEQERAGSVCVLKNRFPRNSEIVWRARVMNPNGEELDDEALESVEVQLADGQTFDMRYGPHPQDDPTDFFWTTSFEVPADYPTGTLDYEIVATAANGATGTFEPFEVTPSLLTITDEVLEPIEEDEGED